MRHHMLHGRRGSVRDVVGQVDEELCKAALGSCVVAEDGGEGGVPKGLGQTLSQSLPGPAVVTQAISAVRRPSPGKSRWYSPKEAAHHVLEEAHSLLFHQLGDHVAKDRPHRVEALIRRTDICQTNVIE